MICEYINTSLGNGANKDIIRELIKTYKMYRSQPNDIITDEVRECDYYTQLESVWQYFNENVTYKLDPENFQYLKTPARLQADGCGDCKSFSIWFGSVLYCLGIPFCFRFVSFGRKKIYTHVYVVANPNTDKQVILDAVEKDSNGVPRYNYARPYTIKLDING